MNLDKNWYSSLKNVPKGNKSRYGRTTASSAGAQSLPWKYTYSRGPGGSLQARRFKSSPELEGMGIQKFALSQVDLPKNWNPNESQFPWESRQRLASDATRQKAFYTGISAGQQSQLTPSFYGKFDPSWSFDQSGYNPFAGFGGTSSKTVASSRMTPQFQPQSVPPYWYDMIKLLQRKPK